MEKLADLLIAFLDIVKADLAQSKKGLFDVGVSLTLTLVSGVCLTAAIAVISYALYLAASDSFGKESAVLITGLFYLVCGGISIWIAKTKTSS